MTSEFVILIGTILLVIGNAKSYGDEERLCSKPEFFKCLNGRCLSHWFVCDGDDDCGDNSDELDCPGDTKKIYHISCLEDQFQCTDQTCIAHEDFCDRKYDCPDKSDEFPGCTEQKKCDEFRCNNKYCVKNEWVCDGYDDCGDFSDEKDCGNRTISPEQCNNKINRFLCDHGRCIWLNKTCDGKDDCGDTSDEHEAECKISADLCKTGIGCSHVCNKTPKGPICSCPPGYRLTNNRTCTDINECSENPELCYQRCINTDGSYYCNCDVGYQIQEDKKTCKVQGGEALMIFSTKKEIRGYYLENEVYFSIARNLSNAVGVSLDANYAYWSDIKNGDAAIFRSLDDGSNREVIITAGLGLPEEIAVDWITGNIYFTDSHWRRIGVCKNDGEFCTVIVKESIDKPRGLALYPFNGEMFWSDFGEKPRISRAGMDGNDIKELVTENLDWPNGLTIDYPMRRLYWIDAKRLIIESINLDGTNRRQVLSTTATHPHSIAVFEDKLYWSDWETKTIQIADKYSGKNRSTLIRDPDPIRGIHIYHPVLKPKISDPCSTNPCSQLCLLGLNRTYSCACTLDKELSVDRHSCKLVVKKKHLVIASGNTFVEYYHEILGKPRITGSSTLKRITHVTYDSITGEIIANDQSNDALFRFNPNSHDLHPIASTTSEYLSGIDFDYYGNNIYWSDLRHRRIEVHSLDTGKNTVFHFTEEPQEIALVPEHGVMYVVFRSRGMFQIDMMPMSRIAPRIHVVEDLRGPKISLAYDSQAQRIYWADENTGRIESVDVQGDDRKVFRTGLRGPVSLAIIDNDVFWTLRSSKNSNQILLQWADKLDRVKGVKSVTLKVTGDAEMMDVTPIGGVYAGNQHSCRDKNGGCSHVCLVMSEPNLHVCACSPGMILDGDKRNCSLQVVCSDDEIRCSDNNECISKTRRCNGIDDCPNGEDEEKCDHINSCGVGEFTCQDGQCVDIKNRCNLRYDCKDHSDEVNCDKDLCKNDEFHCLNGQCISKFHVCDGHNDCDDVSDETNCHRHVCDEGSFRCASGTCIPKSWECDGANDCDDSSDEAGERCRLSKCPNDLFQCSNKRCVDQALRCDNIDDCGDNSDEDKKMCEKKNSVHGTCTQNEYKCHGTEKCISLRLRCDGKQDCPKNDDEHRCTQCELDEFVCGNKKCVPSSWVCDKFDDCGDKSDEIDCDLVNHKKFSNFTYGTPSDCEEFKCKIGTCLPYEKVCDGKSDCFDGSDEGGECEKACTGADATPCDQVCQKTPEGSKCSCQKGYKMEVSSINEVLCVDENECEQQACPQICHNLPGSFTCSCFDGYVLRSNRVSCKVAGEAMEIITATKGDIRKLSSSLSSIEVIHRHPNADVTGLDVNMRKKTIYWSNEITGTINRLNLETGDFKWVQGFGRPEKLAVDWITDNIYFHDGEQPASIKACNLDKQKCARIVSLENSARLMSIAVDSKNGWLFWSQTSFKPFEKPIGNIYRTDFSGSSRIAIANDQVGIVSGITIDHARSHLYWADALLDVVERSNLDGSDREVFLKHQIFQPRGINIFEDSLYWLMGSSGVLKKCAIHGDKMCESINIQQSNIDELFVISHNTRQPEVNDVCENHICDHICIIRNNAPACICSDGTLTDSSCEKTEIVGNPIQFQSSMFGKKNTSMNSRSQSSLFAGIFITVAVGITVMSTYYYYQKKKCTLRKMQDLSIHFRNPTFGARSSTPMANDYIVPVLPPGEHEYENPLTDTQIAKQVQKATGRKVLEVNSDFSENEFDEAPYNHNTRLIK